jgi:hypothetical protein
MRFCRRRRREAPFGDRDAPAPDGKPSHNVLSNLE